MWDRCLIDVDLKVFAIWVQYPAGVIQKWTGSWRKFLSNYNTSLQFTRKVLGVCQHIISICDKDIWSCGSTSFQFVTKIFDRVAAHHFNLCENFRACGSTSLQFICENIRACGSTSLQFICENVRACGSTSLQFVCENIQACGSTSLQIICENIRTCGSTSLPVVRKELASGSTFFQLVRKRLNMDKHITSIWRKRFSMCYAI